MEEKTYQRNKLSYSSCSLAKTFAYITVISKYCLQNFIFFNCSSTATLSTVVSTRSNDLFSNMLTLDGGNYNVSWNFNATSDTLEFLVEVRTVGWVGFGVAEAPAEGMVDYDVAIGGVMNDGTSYFQVS